MNVACFFRRSNAVACAAVLACGTSAPDIARAASGDSSVLTYHGDTLRTGWNPNESALTAANVNAGTFGLLATVPLDDQVDAQPLVSGAQTVSGGNAPGVYDVAYVVTENDSVYAIDTATGTILMQRNLGAPVPKSATPGSCGNNGPDLGIGSTPVIDAATNTLYLIADTYANAVPAFVVHALDTRTLADQVAPVTVAASHTLSNGTVGQFSAVSSRQRSALLETNGAIYAAFASYCDHAANTTRGWVLGWKTGSLAPLASNVTTDALGTSPHAIFLSSVWMSGAGLATDGAGSIYFITGNSDGASYDGVNDVQESFVRESGDLTRLQGIFTPSNQSSLDAGDVDYGAGGVLLMPSSKTTPYQVAAAAGKDGRLFLIDRNLPGGFSSTTNNVLGTYAIGGCWCAPSAYVAPDGLPRIVTSGGKTVGVWELQAAATVTLTQLAQSAALTTGQDGGFFTSVSSNGTTPGSAVVWAVSRPTSHATPSVQLYAVDPSSGATLFNAVAGTWPSTGGNANLVPTVANGRVLVATYQQLAIFGPLAPGARARAAVFVPGPPPARLAPNQHEVYGRIEALRGERMLLRTRTGRLAAIDVAAAARASTTTVLYPGEFVDVRTIDAPGGLIVAIAIDRAKTSPALWGPDR